MGVPALVAILIALLTTSCGDDDVSTAVATTTGSTQAPATAKPTTDGPATVATSDAGSPLRRRDAPPAGVAASFSYLVAGGPPCSNTDLARPGLLILGPKTEIGTTFTFCFGGFVLGAEAEVEVRRPDGTVHQERVPAPWLRWYGVPGDPLGRYDVVAVQGPRTIAGSFMLSAASQPQMQPLPPTAGPAGTTFSFALAGFPPERPVELHLCRPSNLTTCSYLTTMTVPADRQGQAIFRLVTRPDDPTGVYCLVPRGVAKPSADSPDCDSAVVFSVR